MTSNRERFEAWYLAEFWEGSNCGRAMLKKEHCGGYTYAKPQELWKVWQAAPPAAAHGDEAVLLLRKLDEQWNAHDGEKQFGKLMLSVESFLAMRAQAGEGGEV